MIRFSFAICLLLLFGVSVASAGEPKPPADLVVLNGKVWTVDAAKPRAEAIAVVNDRIAAVGSNEEIKKWLGPHTRTLDARGKTVLPGLIDAHVHFSTGGFDVSGVQLKDARNREDLRRASANTRKSFPKANGFWAARGTTKTGRARRCPRASGSTSSRRTIPCSSAATTGTWPWPTAWR